VNRLARLVRPSFADDAERLLLVLLHGIGSDEADLYYAAEGIDERYMIVSLRAPIAFEAGGYAWFSLGWDESGIRYDAAEARNSLQLLSTELRTLSEENRIPARRLIVGGFSQGAIMSLAALLNDPTSVGGALLMSGAVVPELLPEHPLDSAKTPVLVQHGVYDPVLPVAQGRAIRDLLSAHGYSPDYREYPMAHQVSMESLRDAQEWLERVLGFDF
jgi:phospholipase/carboxylesterase